MKLNYGYGIDKLNVNIQVAIVEINGVYCLPSIIISDSEAPGVIMADVMFVDMNIKRIKVRFIDPKTERVRSETIDITHNDMVNYLNI